MRERVLGAGQQALGQGETEVGEQFGEAGTGARKLEPQAAGGDAQLAGDVFERQLIEFETLREQLLDLLDQIVAAQFGQAALGQIFMQFEQVRIHAWRAVVENLRLEPNQNGRASSREQV